MIQELSSTKDLEMTYIREHPFNDLFDRGVVSYQLLKYFYNGWGVSVIGPKGGPWEVAPLHWWPDKFIEGGINHCVVYEKDKKHKVSKKLDAMGFTVICKDYAAVEKDIEMVIKLYERELKRGKDGNLSRLYKLCPH